MKWTKGLRLHFASFDWSWLFFCVCLALSVLLFLVHSSPFHACGSMGLCVRFFVYFFSSWTAKAQKANTHLNKNELLVYKEKLRFNRWPLVHFIQLALISHCSRYPNIIFLSFSDALIRTTCFCDAHGTHSLANIKTVFFANRFSALHFNVGICVKFGQLSAT